MQACNEGAGTTCATSTAVSGAALDAVCSHVATAAAHGQTLVEHREVLHPPPVSTTMHTSTSSKQLDSNTADGGAIHTNHQVRLLTSCSSYFVNMDDDSYWHSSSPTSPDPHPPPIDKDSPTSHTPTVPPNQLNQHHRSCRALEQLNPKHTCKQQDSLPCATVPCNHALGAAVEPDQASAPTPHAPAQTDHSQRVQRKVKNRRSDACSFSSSAASNPAAAVLRQALHGLWRLWSFRPQSSKHQHAQACLSGVNGTADAVASTASGAGSGGAYIPINAPAVAQVHPNSMSQHSPPHVTQAAGHCASECTMMEAGADAICDLAACMRADVHSSAAAAAPDVVGGLVFKHVLYPCKLVPCIREDTEADNCRREEQHEHMAKSQPASAMVDDRSSAEVADRGQHPIHQNSNTATTTAKHYARQLDPTCTYYTDSSVSSSAASVDNSPHHTDAATLVALHSAYHQTRAAPAHNCQAGHLTNPALRDSAVKSAPPSPMTSPDVSRRGTTCSTDGGPTTPLSPCRLLQPLRMSFTRGESLDRADCDASHFSKDRLPEAAEADNICAHGGTFGSCMDLHSSEQVHPLPQLPPQSPHATLAAASQQQLESKGGKAMQGDAPPDKEPDPLTLLPPLPELPPPADHPNPLLVREKRNYLDGRSKEYRMGTWRKLLAMLTLMVYCGWPYLIFGILIGSLFSRTIFMVAIFLFSTLLLPAGPKFWEAFLGSGLFRLWRDYFNFSFTYDDYFELQHSRYVFVLYPHGVFPLSQCVSNSLYHQVWEGHRTHCLAASCLWYIPLWKHLKTWMGAAPATAAEFRKIIPHNSVAVIAGGLAELFMAHPDEERIMLLCRKGFVRMAVEYGVPIVPVFHFGNSLLLRFAPHMIQPLARRLQCVMGVAIGKWGTPIPQQLPLMMSVGRPILVHHLPRDHPAFEAHVNEVHARVVDAVRALYDKNAPLYGGKYRPLRIY